MKHVFKKGKTLLVDGPASVSLLSGKISVLGAPLQRGEKLIVREGKRLNVPTPVNDILCQLVKAMTFRSRDR